MDIMKQVEAIDKITNKKAWQKQLILSLIDKL